MTGLAAITMAYGMGYHHDDMGGGWWILMLLGMVAFWGAIIAISIWLVRGGLSSRSEQPQEVLRRRLADGSISVEEYEQRRAVLESSTPTGRDETPRADPTDEPPAPSPSRPS